MTKHSPTRRSLLLAAASAPLAYVYTAWASGNQPRLPAREIASRFAALEPAGSRLGVAALNTANGMRVHHRADERFPFCSTAKVLVASAILKRAMTENNLLQQRIVYSKNELVTYSPITEKHAGIGMTVAQLCAAALQYSDNTAANLLVKMLGGPAAVTSFARSLGDTVFRLDRAEPELNTAIPGDVRDTTTPAQMVSTLQQLTLGKVLSPPYRTQLVTWMLGNTTGATKIRAGVPTGWVVADKTGGGDYGTTNDIAVVWPASKIPIVLALYFTQHAKNAPYRDDIIANATRIAMEALTVNHHPTRQRQTAA
jgi:beta-lactamase class A